MNKQAKAVTPRVIVQMLIFIVVVPLLPLLISGRWNWWEAWVYAFLSIVGFAVSRVLAARRNPDIIAERASFMRHENAQSWDKPMTLLIGIGSILIMAVVGLDGLFGWPPTFSLPVKIAAAVMLLAGYVWSSYALVANRYFSGMVRLQTDRGHQVVTGGPYRWMRHPGYAGAVVTYLAVPLLLDSAWAFLPSVLLIIVMVIRTSLEDRFLQAELKGYRAYAKQVRYRLLPGVW